MSEQMWEADMPAEPPPVTVERVEPAAEAPANPWPRTPTAPAGQGGDEKPAPDPLKLFKPVTLQGKPVPDREWLAQDWIPMGVVSAFYGDGGMGKTLLAQQLMTSCVTGKPWLGLPVMRVPVIGFFCEDSIDELHRRQADINAAYGCDFADLVDAVWISRLGFDNLLMTFHQGVGELTPTYDLFAVEAR